VSETRRVHGDAQRESDAGSVNEELRDDDETTSFTNQVASVQLASGEDASTQAIPISAGKSS
jgi:hypothetical protein